MTIQPNINNLLSALAPSLTLPTTMVAGLAAQNTRFDAALLQAAKVVQDGSNQGVEQALTPKVEEALKSLFSQLAQKPAEQLQQLAKQPELLKPVVEAIAQAQGLDSQESTVLQSLAPLATQNLVQALDSLKVSPVETAPLGQPGKISGPQGGEPGKTVDPAQTFMPAAAVDRMNVDDPKVTASITGSASNTGEANTDKPALPTVAPARNQDRSTDLHASLAQAVVWTGPLVSTRTDDGTSADSALSLAARPVSTEAAAPVAPAAVTVSTLQPLQTKPQVAEQNASQSPVASTPAAAPSQAPVAVAVASQPIQAPANASTPPPAPQDAAPVQVTLPAAERQIPVAPEAQVPQSAPQPRAIAPARSQAAPVAVSTKSATEQTLDFKIAALPSDAPATPIQDGSLFVLKGDGSTQGTQQVQIPSQAPQPQPVAVQVQPLALQAASPAPVAAAAAQPVTSTSTVAQAPQADVSPVVPAFVPSAPVPAPAVATIPVAAVPQAPAAVPVAVIASLPVPVPQQQAVTSEEPSVNTPKAEAAPAAAESALAPAAPAPQVLQSSVGFQVLKHSSPQDAAQPGFSFGPDTLRNLVGQVSRQAGVRDAAFAQVTDALLDGATKETSRLIIKLKPASLGEVQVDLSVEGGKVTARLVASTPEVRDAFVRDLPAFKANLEAQGLRVDQVAVAVRGEGNLNAQSQNQGQPQNPWVNAVPSLPKNDSPLAASAAFAAWSQPSGSDTLFSALA